VHVHGALLDVGIVAPDLVEQPGAAEDAPRVRHEEMQQPELGGPQLDVALAEAHAVRCGVELQPRELDDVVGQLRGAPAHHRLDARQELAARIRLGDIVVGAAFQRGHLVLLARAITDQHDRDVPGALVAAQAARERQSGNAGQNPVEHHQIGTRAAHQRLGLRQVLCALHLVAGALQIDGEQIAHRHFIVHHQH
jgi:hypothetical protein